MTDLSRLSDHFAPDRVSWRVGSTTERDGKVRGLALAYVDARDIMDRLDDVLGPANWQDRYRRENETTICTLSLRIDGEWIAKEDGSGDTDVEAEKGALSKALVRAAVKWQIGRYLYDLDSPWVDCDKRGRSVVIKSTEHARLRALLTRTFRQAPATTPEAFSDNDRGTPFDDVPSAGGVKNGTPFDDHLDSKGLYRAQCLDTIHSLKDAQALTTWWKSDEQKKARLDFGLDQNEVDSLRTALADRLQEIGGARTEGSVAVNGKPAGNGRGEHRGGQVAA